MKKQSKRSVPHETGLNDSLKDPVFAAHFLSSIIDGLPNEEATEMLVDGILQIAKAQGMTNVSKRTGILREALYSAFKKRANPTLSTLHGVLDGMGIEMTFRAKKAAR